jgi:hypothetical protein
VPLLLQSSGICRASVLLFASCTAMYHILLRVMHPGSHVLQCRHCADALCGHCPAVCSYLVKSRMHVAYMHCRAATVLMYLRNTALRCSCVFSQRMHVAHVCCRAATVLIYLGDVEEGGETTLPLGKFINEGRQRLTNPSEHASCFTGCSFSKHGRQPICACGQVHR